MKMQDPTMSPTIFFTTLGLLLGTVLIVFGMKYLAQARQTANGTAREEGYRALAEKTASVLAAQQADLADVKTRLASVETLLKTVE
jgi:uncharacterized membrane protein